MLKELVDVRRMRDCDGMVKIGWFWHPWLYFMNHGGWFYFEATKPVCTLKWWWRFCITIPRSRGQLR